MAPETEIIPIKVLDKNLKCTSYKLIETLKKLLDMEVDIINLSLSTSNNKEFFEISEVCRQLTEQGKIIVASKANNGATSYPAESKFAIGVTGNPFVRNEEFWFDGRKSIQCVASRTPCIVDLGNMEYAFYSGNSKATACFTGILANKFDTIKNLSISERTDYITRSAIKNRWTETDLIANIESCLVYECKGDEEILEYLHIIFKEYNMKSDKYLYEYVGLDGILDAVRTIIGQYNLNLSEMELNLYDFMTLQSLSMKIRYALKGGYSNV